MIARPIRFVGDLAELPTHVYSHRSLTWWGVVAFMLIEGSGFALAIAAYFFLMSNQHSWPPEGIAPPDLLPGTLFTIVLLLSVIPNIWLQKAARAEQLDKVRIGLLILTGFGIVLLVIRAFEFGALNVHWTTNAYGSIQWALLLLHLTHVGTDWIDTSVLTALMFTKQGRTGRRFVDVTENALYWHFVVLTWLPLYLMIYWLPRWL
ncbi:MAG: cytochrome oxidase subunit [Alphaproteobacteria bacterium]|nr:cytochrome oxidase subunit [Alphaproteobacteria bacterium]